jgi:hypothetical protein
MSDAARANRLLYQWMETNQRVYSLAFEASAVIMLRMLRLAWGGAASQVEMRRMFNEKIVAAFELNTRAMTGSLGQSAEDIAAKTLSHYRRKVRANRRRLLAGGK